LYETSREFAAALDLRTVLHRVIFLSMKTVGAVSGSIIVLDDLGTPVESAFLLHDQPHDQTTLHLRMTYERGLAGWVGRIRQAVLIDDTSKDERWLQRPDDAVERTGPKSAVSCPILAREQLVGVITLVHPQPGFFTQDHLELVKAIADQAGVAILNARLYAESQRQAQVMTAVAESATVITASLNLDEVLQRILEQISQALGVQGVMLALVEPETADLIVRASIPDLEPRSTGRRIAAGQGVLGWVAQEELGAVIHNVQEDKRFLESVDQLLGFECRSILAAPIRSQGQVIGALEVYNPSHGAFEADDLLVLMGIGSLAGTAIRHAQLYESLQTAHKRYYDLFEDSIDSILITDLKGQILEANWPAQALIGIEDQPLCERYVFDLYSIDQDQLRADLDKLDIGQTIAFETVLLLLQERRIPVQVYVRKICSNSLAHLQWIIRDISERKDLDRFREDMTAMIYHDLRSPLSNIVASLQMLSTTPTVQQDETAALLLGIARRSTERIQRLTESLLDISRIESGQVIANRIPAQLTDLLAEAVEVVISAARSRQIELQIDAAPDLPLVNIDLEMMRRVIINLLENAIKFSPSNAKIQVQVGLHGDMVRLSVTDAGPGISVADQERIFDKFTRLQSGDGLRGLGLGLAFCRFALNGHGGKIWVESELGVGSTFILTLPVAEAETNQSLIDSE
jgi:PAS domain S-box-containing protein